MACQVLGDRRSLTLRDLERHERHHVVPDALRDHVRAGSFWAFNKEIPPDTAGAIARAAVGNRTLILEPVKAANDERVTELG